MPTTRSRSSCLFILLIISSLMPARAAVKTWQKDADGVSFVLDIGVMKVHICQSDIVEVKYTILSELPSHVSLVVNNAWTTATLFTVTEFSWKDRLGTLTISDTKGDFPGRLKQRVFNIVIVDSHKGIGEHATMEGGKMINYTGKAMSIGLRSPALSGNRRP